MLATYLQATFMILMAEMGDKTQILAMTFATKYRIKQIVIGVMIGAFLNHGLAILLGSLLTKVVPLEAMQLVAGLLFIGFAFWSLKIEEEEAEETVKYSYGPIVTVALAFFLGELGDKTQLTALTFGASSDYPFAVLLGTVSGMVLTSLMGIWVGMKLGHKIPEMQLKLGAFFVFMFFGVSKCVMSPYLSPMNLWMAFAVALGVLGLSLWRILKFVRQMNTVEETLLKTKAEALYEHLHKLQNEVEALCLGEVHCESCRGSACCIGFMKDILEKSSRGDVVEAVDIRQINALIERQFNPTLTRSVLAELMMYYEAYPEEYLENLMLKNLRSVVERVLFGEVIENLKQYEMYKIEIMKKDQALGLITSPVERI